ncbi:MAG: hypothetical protein IJ072_07215 [Oscillospiraceae bacterium]|nr:hypothetical protein [Oscillospiraceae bacterium]
MEMHKIDYTIKLTGSKLFDVVMYNTAKNLCADFPGLTFDYDTTEIRIHGELNDYWFNKYNETMFEKMGGN